MSGLGFPGMQHAVRQSELELIFPLISRIENVPLRKDSCQFALGSIHGPDTRCPRHAAYQHSLGYIATWSADVYIPGIILLHAGEHFSL